jgi:hypothetical protein
MNFFLENLRNPVRINRASAALANFLPVNSTVDLQLYSMLLDLMVSYYLLDLPRVHVVGTAVYIHVYIVQYCTRVLLLSNLQQVIVCGLRAGYVRCSKFSTYTNLVRIRYQCALVYQRYQI